MAEQNASLTIKDGAEWEGGVSVKNELGMKHGTVKKRAILYKWSKRMVKQRRLEVRHQLLCAEGVNSWMCPEYFLPS